MNNQGVCVCTRLGTFTVTMQKLLLCNRNVTRETKPGTRPAIRPVFPPNDACCHLPLGEKRDFYMPGDSL